jgi:hypothetical protein
MRYIIFSGTGIRNRYESAKSASEAMTRVLQLMKLRRPGVRIEDGFGGEVSFFQLKDAAVSEKRASGLKADTLDQRDVRRR